MLFNAICFVQYRHIQQALAVIQLKYEQFDLHSVKAVRGLVCIFDVFGVISLDASVEAIKVPAQLTHCSLSIQLVCFNAITSTV